VSVPWGTLVNVVAVIIGSAVGLLLHRGLPDRLRGIIFQGIGLATLVIGMLNALAVVEPVPDTGSAGKHLMELIFSVLIGGLIGEWINIEARLEKAGDWLKARVHSGDSRFTEGLVTAFLIFCIGPMTVVGALDEGIRADHNLLYAKSILDCFMSAALASTFGLGVLFSIIPLFIFQYGITLLGVGAQSVLNEVVVNQLTAVGGVLILGLGINLLELRRLRIANLLPALVVVVILALVLG
jgi:uncharacterized membrane protein YqgA involved in biofilm formation